jgi:hypothetical protein
MAIGAVIFAPPKGTNCIKEQGLAMSFALEQLITDRPSFHAWPDGTPANWSVATAVLRFMTEHLRPGMTTLETGAGQTTAACAIVGTHHICVTPDAAQVERIRTYLDGLAIQYDVKFIVESSDVALASGIGIPDRLDFVLIDGAHRFPFPILDWHYTQNRVPVGGIVVVDDFIMPSVRILYDFLLLEDDWELIRALEVTAFFRRVKRTENVWDWADQAINKSHLEMVRKKAGLEQRAKLTPFLNWARSCRKG